MNGSKLKLFLVVQQASGRDFTRAIFLDEAKAYKYAERYDWCQVEETTTEDEIEDFPTYDEGYAKGYDAGRVQGREELQYQRRGHDMGQ